MAMKFQREATSGFAITGYTADAISVAGVEFAHSLRVAHASAAVPWAVTTFAEITAATVADGEACATRKLCPYSTPATLIASAV